MFVLERLNETQAMCLEHTYLEADIHCSDDDTGVEKCARGFPDSYTKLC